MWTSIRNNNNIKSYIRFFFLSWRTDSLNIITFFITLVWCGSLSKEGMLQGTWRGVQRIAIFYFVLYTFYIFLYRSHMQFMSRKMDIVMKLDCPQHTVPVCQGRVQVRSVFKFSRLPHSQLYIFWLLKGVTELSKRMQVMPSRFWCRKAPYIRIPSFTCRWWWASMIINRLSLSLWGMYLI